jgi:hypothetical protein
MTCIYRKEILFDLANILKPTTKTLKNGIRKVLELFLYCKYVVEHFKISKFHY